VSDLSEESGDIVSEEIVLDETVLVEIEVDETEADTDAPVLIFNAGTHEEAEVVRATLDAAGIATSMQGNTINPYMGALDAPMSDTAAMGIYVPPSQVEAAKAILTAPAPTEEELTAEEEADPRTLEEAEAAVKNA
jgi:hypothetical protein